MDVSIMNKYNWSMVFARRFKAMRQGSMVFARRFKAVRLGCIIFGLVCSTMSVCAQVNVSFVDNIRTIQTHINGRWGEQPVILLGSGQYVDISFDDLQRSYVRYTYRITHCSANWESSELYDGDFMTGINGSTVIDTYEQSVNTEMLYNHYHFRLPNATHKLLVSGNYQVDIFDDEDDENPVASVCFSILEPKVGIDMKVSANTDIDSYQTHQQVDMTINYQTLSTTNPELELIPVVTQNRRWDSRVMELKPSYLRPSQLVYTHNRSLIFAAGNEYRRFEILSPYVPTMRVDKMKYETSLYHAYIFEDQPAKNYKYDQDQNGRFLIRNSDNSNNDVESDYFVTHFVLKTPQIPDGDLYLFGDLTDNMLWDENRMEYNLLEHQYEISVLLKQGSYNYQYLFVRNGEAVGRTAPTEGDFHQTENEYCVYVYHRPFGGRYDKLVGFKSMNFKE